MRASVNAHGKNFLLCTQLQHCSVHNTIKASDLDRIVRNDETLSWAFPNGMYKDETIGINIPEQVYKMNVGKHPTIKDVLIANTINATGDKTRFCLGVDSDTLLPAAYIGFANMGIF